MVKVKVTISPEEWTLIPGIDEGRETVPVGLKDKLQEAIDQRYHARENSWGWDPAALTNGCASALCRCLDIRFIEGLCPRGTKFVSEFGVGAQKDSKEDPNGSVLGGTFEALGFEEGDDDHALALVRGGTLMHWFRRDLARVGVIWATVHDYGLMMSYRMGISDFQKKEILATGVQEMSFKNGEFVNIEEWEKLCWYLKAMEKPVVRKMAEKEVQQE